MGKPNKKSGNYSKNADKRTSNFSNHKQKVEKAKVNGGVLTYSKPLTVSELAESIGLTPSEIIKYLFLFLFFFIIYLHYHKNYNNYYSQLLYDL